MIFTHTRKIGPKFFNGNVTVFTFYLHYFIEYCKYENMLRVDIYNLDMMPLDIPKNFKLKLKRRKHD